MGLWRDLLRVLGLTDDARVHISAPGIEVRITGDPDQVRALLVVVKNDLERAARARERTKRQGLHARNRLSTDGRPIPQPVASRASQYVQPTELDEMDSPYALPDPLVVPVEESTPEMIAPDRKDRKGGYAVEPATLVPDAGARTREDLIARIADLGEAPSVRIDERPAVNRTESPPAEIGSTKIDSDPIPVHEPGPDADDDVEAEDEEEEEREDTAVARNPSDLARYGAQESAEGLEAPAIARRASPFVTDGGPTLTPVTQAELERMPKKPTDARRAVGENEEETKETHRERS